MDFIIYKPFFFYVSNVKYNFEILSIVYAKFILRLKIKIKYVNN